MGLGPVRKVRTTTRPKAAPKSPASA
jgi:hypothetical protein